MTLRHWIDRLWKSRILTNLGVANPINPYVVVVWDKIKSGLVALCPCVDRATTNKKTIRISFLRSQKSLFLTLRDLAKLSQIFLYVPATTYN